MTSDNFTVLTFYFNHAWFQRFTLDSISYLVFLNQLVEWIQSFNDCAYMLVASHYAWNVFCHESFNQWELVSLFDISLAELSRLVLADSVNVTIGFESHNEITATSQSRYALHQSELIVIIRLHNLVLREPLGTNCELFQCFGLEVDSVKVAFLCLNDSSFSSAVIANGLIETEGLWVGLSKRIAVTPAQQVWWLINNSKSLAASAYYIIVLESQIKFELLFSCRLIVWI